MDNNKIIEGFTKITTLFAAVTQWLRMRNNDLHCAVIDYMVNKIEYKWAKIELSSYHAEVFI